MPCIVGVLALQGGFHEHLKLLQDAAQRLGPNSPMDYRFVEVRTREQLDRVDALIIPGGESTTISLVAAQSGLLEPLRDFVKVQRKPTWGTCAGLVLLSDEVSATKQGGQELIGGLGVRVHRNHFGRQIESFESNLDLSFLPPDLDPSAPFPGVFIRAPVVEDILLDRSLHVLSKLPNRVTKTQGISQANIHGDSGDIVAVKQGNIVGTSFHPELTKDSRMHAWWLKEIGKHLIKQ